jgi:Domain of unknown function (DUF4189)
MKTGIAMLFVCGMLTAINMNPSYAYKYGSIAAGMCEKDVGRGASNISQNDADDRSKKFCGNKSCEVVAMVAAPNCAAYAVSRGRCGITGAGDSVGYVDGENPREKARAEALRKCNANFGSAGSPCHVRTDICPATYDH